MKELSIKKSMFGKEIEIMLRGVNLFLFEDIIQKVYDLGLSQQKIFSFFDKNSELSNLNKKRSLNVSEDLLNVLNKAIILCEETNGKYDISIGKQIIKRKNGEELIKLNCSYKDIKIEGNKVTLDHEDVLIDLGSIAKGYIVDKMIDYLLEEGILSGLIDARGDIKVFGDKPELIGIQNPRDKNKIIHTILVKNKAIATSGDYNQFYGNYGYPHIINKKNIISVSVVAPTLEEADVYATALFVLNDKERENLINDNKEIKVLTIDLNLNIRYFNGFKDLIYRGKL